MREGWTRLGSIPGEVPSGPLRPLVTDDAYHGHGQARQKDDPCLWEIAIGTDTGGWSAAACYLIYLQPVESVRISAGSVWIPSMTMFAWRNPRET